MNPEDLLKRLGLDEKLPAYELPPRIPKTERPGQFVQDYGHGPREYPEGDIVHPSPTALVADAWDYAKGEELWEESNEAGNPEDWTDFFVACFRKEPELIQKCEYPVRQEFVKRLLESPEYITLHADTVRNLFKSKAAAKQLHKQFTGMIQERRKRQTSPHHTKRQKEQCAEDDEMKLLLAVAEGCKEAVEEGEQIDEQMSCLGYGPGDPNTQQLNPEKIAESFRKIKDNQRLRKIFERAGRYLRCADGKQRQKQSHGYDDMVGITLDDDPSKLLTCELARLDDPDLEDEVLYRIASKQAMARQYHGIEKVGKGPVVVCVDESGSMDGDPIIEAKSFALGMYRIARHQSRFFCFCSYSGGTEGIKLVIPPGKHKDDELLNYLTHFFGGGTELDVPLDLLPNKWWDEMVKDGLKRGHTDLILLTDAICNVSDEMIQNFLKWKSTETVKTISFVIGQRSAGDLAKVSDEVHFCNQLSVNDPGVLSAFSI